MNGLLHALFVLLSAGLVAAKAPNIVLIYADDMGWEGPSCYGYSYHETPNIDRLAKDGLRFTNAYSGAPVCAPSRAVLLSGQYVGRHGIYRINQVEKAHAKARKTVPPTNLMELPLEIKTIADSLKSAGYETGYAGKWHLGFDAAHLPGKRGFDEHLTTRSPSGDKRYFFPDFSTIPAREYPEGTYMTDAVTEFAVDFLKKKRDKPFFLYLPYFNVHGPYEAKPETIDYFRKKDPKMSEVEATYAAMHAHLDTAVGTIQTTLEERGLTGETLVIFTSDNGMTSKFLLSLRGGKGTLYEAGIRVPMIFKWPGVIEPGKVSDVPVHQVDFFPTLLDVASAAAPSNQVLDGVSLQPLLRNETSDPLDGRPLFWHFPTYMKYSAKQGAYEVTPCSAMREGKWKLVNYFTPDRAATEQLELYDLESDPGEKHNLAAKHPELATRLLGKLEKWRVDTGAPMPVARDPAPEPAKEGAGLSRPNVLFIAVDDLRPALGCYGDKHAITPNIDRLAAAGTVFDHAYCQQAVCSPSRVSVMTGLRPDSTKVHDLTTVFRDVIPNVLTLPQHFRNHGYHTESIGKIFHKPHMQDDANSWSVPSVRGKGGQWHSPKSQALRQRLLAEAKNMGLSGKPAYYHTLGPPTDSSDLPDESYADGDVARKAIASLRDRAMKKESFFLAIGFIKPHLPFTAPKRYWDLHDPANLPLSPQPTWPSGTPACAETRWGELRSYHGMPTEGPVSKEEARHLVHGYYACTTFTDKLIGDVLGELETLGLANKTAVVLWSDHGWKLGDYGAWCKHSNFEVDVRVPLVIRHPQGLGAGQRSQALVELVDLYPTLCELTGLPTPAPLEGSSLAPLLKDPQQAWKTAAFSQWPGRIDKRPVTGYSMRTEEWRYTEWTDRASGRVLASELHDHHDSLNLASANLAEDPRHADLVTRLSNQLKSGWRSAAPIP